MAAPCRSPISPATARDEETACGFAELMCCPAKGRCSGHFLQIEVPEQVDAMIDRLLALSL